MYLRENEIKKIKQIWNIIQDLLLIVLNIVFAYDHFIHAKEPSNYLLYLALLIYIQSLLGKGDKIN